jgi:hypothetical protein
MIRVGIFLLLLPQLLWGKPLPAFMDSGEVGQAILLNRLGTCYAITPAHVIDGGFFATVIGGLPTAPQGDADVLMTFGYDLALLRVSGAVEGDCTEGYRRESSQDDLFAEATTGHLLTVRSDGSISRQQVSIVDTGMIHVQVKPMAGGEPLMKGMSGSLLEVRDRPAGLLMSVDPENGHGKVLRYDRVTETIAPFFGDSRSAAAQKIATRAAPAKSAIEGLSVIRWSSPPLDGNSRAPNLLDGDPDTSWYAKPAGFPVDIEIRLSDGKSRVLGQVELVAGGVTPKQRLPRDFEVMVSNKEKGGWNPVGSATLFAADGGKTLQFAPVRGKRLLLRIHSNWGDSEAVGLGELRIQ